LHLATGQRKIIKARKSTMLIGRNVLIGETPSKQSLRSQTVFVAMTGSPANFSRDIAHEFCFNPCLSNPSFAFSLSSAARIASLTGKSNEK